jgi:hypothetical protein
MSPFLTLGASVEEAIPIIAIAGGLMIAALAIITGTITSITKTKAREESRREIAAYVAEGSMTPDDAQRIIEAGMPACDRTKQRRA